MTSTSCDPTHRDADGWETVARHDFDGVAELDATITAALGDDHPDDRPLYAAVDTEPAERFLSSAAGNDATVTFRLADRVVRVSADGRVQLRRHDPSPDSSE